jgi:16S rRNA (adenine1518-N6/adenine1519-N6)-dimethyltransferase
MMGVRDPKQIVAALPQDLLDRRAEQVAPDEYARLADLIIEAMKRDDPDLQG